MTATVFLSFFDLDGVGKPRLCKVKSCDFSIHTEKNILFSESEGRRKEDHNAMMSC